MRETGASRARHLVVAGLLLAVVVAGGAWLQDHLESAERDRAWLAEKNKEDREYEEQRAKYLRERDMDRQRSRTLDRLGREWYQATLRYNNDGKTDLDKIRKDLAAARQMIFQDFDYLSNGSDCPPDFPIKGNDLPPYEQPFRDSFIYHKPEWVFYGATIPEACFKDEAEARRDGYRASKVR